MANDMTQPTAEAWMCGAFEPARSWSRSVYRCTEPHDHDGSHRAEIDGETVAAWPRADALTRGDTDG